MPTNDYPSFGGLCDFIASRYRQLHAPTPIPEASCLEASLAIPGGISIGGVRQRERVNYRDSKRLLQSDREPPGNRYPVPSHGRRELSDQRLRGHYDEELCDRAPPALDR